MQMLGRQPEEVRVHEFNMRARGILIAVDGAGGNGSRPRLWQTALQRHRPDVRRFPALSDGAET
ncbi:MAG TPA: hypothetical protein DIW77_09930, partial [Chromatiaceae bacterium]|nr:hypothetical protein [Chromatiaceae bacterium]